MGYSGGAVLGSSQWFGLREYARAGGQTRAGRFIVCVSTYGRGTPLPELLPAEREQLIEWKWRQIRDQTGNSSKIVLGAKRGHGGGGAGAESERRTTVQCNRLAGAQPRHSAPGRRG